MHRLLVCQIQGRQRSTNRNGVLHRAEAPPHRCSLSIQKRQQLPKHSAYWTRHPTHRRQQILQQWLRYRRLRFNRHLLRCQGPIRRWYCTLIFRLIQFASFYPIVHCRSIEGGNCGRHWLSWSGVWGLDEHTREAEWYHDKPSSGRKAASEQETLGFSRHRWSHWRHRLL